MIEITDQSRVLVALVAGATVKNAIFWLLRNKHVKRYVGTVSSINVYPVKSARALQDVSSADLTKLGFVKDGAGDRHWIITYNGLCQNITSIPRLVLVSTAVQGTNLKLTAPEMPPLLLPLNTASEKTKLVTLKIRFLEQPALDCGDEAAAWISKFLGKEGLRLNYSAPDIPKRYSINVVKDWSTYAKEGEQIAFQDFDNCMIMSESSLAELNSRIGRDIPAGQFRPNLMIKTDKPFDEDNWNTVYIGKTARVRFIDDCQRCSITTVDIETAETDKGKQPLTELKSFRCKEKFGPNRPVMGIRTNVEVEGEIRIGDSVYVVDK